MRKLVFFMPFLMAFMVGLFGSALKAQSTFQRKGFIFGAAAGGSYLSLTATGTEEQRLGTASFPNFKLGWMVTPRAAVALLLPGSIYVTNDDSRERDRGFEGIIPSFQYWAKDRWWVLGGAGLTLDAPAFYDIETPEERKFHFGPSAVVATGYEIYRRKRFALDVQARVHAGQANIQNNGKRTGVALTIGVGVNWY